MNQVRRQYRIARMSRRVASTIGVVSLVAGLQAAAADEDPAVAALTRPQSSVDVGSGLISDDSYKFGEYNGLQKEGGFTRGRFHIYGGRTYKPGRGTPGGAQ